MLNSFVTPKEIQKHLKLVCESENQAEPGLLRGYEDEWNHRAERAAHNA